MLELMRGRIRAVNDRLQWDGCWETWGDRLIRGDQHLFQVLNQACALVGSPKLIIGPWAMAKELLALNNSAWNDTSDGRLGGDFPFHRDLDAERKFFLEQGYIGRYQGAQVFASIHADGWGDTADSAYVSSATEPKEIEYDGSNVAIIEL